jgi:hypothetical protein
LRLFRTLTPGRIVDRSAEFPRIQKPNSFPADQAVDKLHEMGLRKLMSRETPECWGASDVSAFPIRDDAASHRLAACIFSTLPAT